MPASASRALAASALWLTACITSCLTVPPRDRVAVVDATDNEASLVDAATVDVNALRESALADQFLDADEAVRLALLGNARLIGRLYALDEARGRLVQAALMPNPVAEAELRFVEGGGGDLFEFGLMQNVVGLFFLPRRKQIAAARFDATRAQVLGQVLDAAAEARTAYRALQAALQREEVAMTATQALEASFDAARELFEAGNIIELDMLMERTAYEEAKLMLTEARARVLAARENLALLLGARGDADWRVDPRLPEPTPIDVDPTELEQRVVEASFDLEQQARELVARGHALGLRRWEAAFPSGSLGVKGEKEPDDTWLVGPLASFSIPIFDQGQGANLEAQAAFRSAYAQFTHEALMLRRLARERLLHAAALLQRARYLREVVLPLRRAVTHRTQEQFNAMQIGVFQLLQAKRAEIRTGDEFVRVLFDHYRARIELESLLLGRRPRGDYGLATFEESAAPTMGAGDSTNGH
ncbi:MAG: TolC family protein [Planctomycetota bacterium]